MKQRTRSRRFALVPLLAAALVTAVGAMARAEDLAEVAEEADRLHDIVRVVCTQSNQVVDPTVADAFYNRHMPRAKRVEVPTNHCDYLQKQELWVNALDPLL